MLASQSPRLLPKMPPIVRLLMLGVFFGILFYMFAFQQTATTVAPDTDVPEVRVIVPTLDRDVLGGAKDGTREQRLLLETEPLRHLLGEAINVVPAVAAALGSPDQPIPLAELRADPAGFRGRWLWYEGELVDLTGPREGHPVKGYSIYEATVKLASGDHVFAAFSLPPAPEVHRGGFVRVEGYLLKLRDTTYPSDITNAPMLVGRQIQRDYADWSPITEIDPRLFDGIDESCYPGTKAWHTIDEDQGIPLWHVAAFARDTSKQRTLADWRKIGTLNYAEVYPRLQANNLVRGEPMRLLGTLVKCTTIAADPNPAGVKFWTAAYVQVHDFRGLLFPVWIPKRIELPLNTGLEVRAHYYRLFAYEGLQGDRFKVPLFVAADLDVFHLDTGKAMREIGFGIGSIATVMIVLFWWAQRRASKDSAAHDRQMDERRRRRRERTPLPASGPTAPPGP
jgi:hypothetical protein